MSVQIVELEKILTQQVVEHRTLLAAVIRHSDSMRGFDPQKLMAAMDEVDASRKRVMLHETRRKALMPQIARAHKLAADITLRQLAEAVPNHKRSLTILREELRDLATQISNKTTISGRVANAMLGHLNTVVRIVAKAMQQTAVYTRQGVPAYAGRVGMIEAVG